jgi:hypothetical protein
MRISHRSVPHRNAPHRRVSHSVHLMGMYVMDVNLTGVHLIGVYLIDVYIMVFCDPPNNVKVEIGWVVVKELARGRGKVDLHFDGGEIR